MNDRLKNVVHNPVIYMRVREREICVMGTIGMDSKKSSKKVMVFGVFDRLHPGHISFLRQAAEYGDELIAVITRDTIVKKLKRKMPNDRERIRKQRVGRIACVSKTIWGDALLGSYEVIREHTPDIICLGYDQHGLREDLEYRIKQGEIASIEITVMQPHNAHIFHTSLLT